MSAAVSRRSCICWPALRCVCATRTSLSGRSRRWILLPQLLSTASASIMRCTSRSKSTSPSLVFSLSLYLLPLHDIPHMNGIIINTYISCIVNTRLLHYHQWYIDGERENSPTQLKNDRIVIILACGNGERRCKLNIYNISIEHT